MELIGPMPCKHLLGRPWLFQPGAHGCSSIAISALATSLGSLGLEICVSKGRTANGL